jgi:hypothetical protein
VADEIRAIFSNCNTAISIDVRPPFLQYTLDPAFLGVIAESIASIRISELKQPIDNRQVETRRYKRPSPDSIAYEKSLITNANKNQGVRQLNSILYDGFLMQRLFGTLIPQSENSIDDVHIIFDSRLTCTFSKDDWRYHGRAIICGTPSIISTTGIVEAPAKPRDFYIRQMQHNAFRRGFQHGPGEKEQENDDDLKKEFAGRYIDYEDPQFDSIATGLVLQALFFFLTDGNPFCDDKDCRLFNAHWQEDLIHCQIENPTLCEKHLGYLELMKERG